MITQPERDSARIYDFATHRMQRIAQQRRAAGATQRFLWGYPGSGLMHAVEFSPLRSGASCRSTRWFSARAR